MGFQLCELFFDNPQILFSLIIPFLSTLCHYRVLLPLLQQLPQQSLFMLLLLQVAVKRQRTIQLLLVAALLHPVVQCYITTHLLPKMRIVRDILFSGHISNVNVDF